MKTLSLVIIFQFMLFLTANCQILSSNQKTKLDSLLSIIEKNDKGMGSVSIFQEGKEIYSNYYGFASIQDNLKANKETKYKIGSMTKMFTAVIILKQIEDKKLNLQTNLHEFFPEIKNADKITIEMLLKHRSGIATPLLPIVLDASNAFLTPISIICSLFHNES